MATRKGTLGNYWYEGELKENSDQVTVKGTVMVSSDVYKGTIFFKQPCPGFYELQKVTGNGKNQAIFAITEPEKIKVSADSMIVDSFLAGSGVHASGNVSVSGLWSAKGNRIDLTYDHRSIPIIERIENGSVIVGDFELSSAKEISLSGFSFECDGTITNRKTKTSITGKITLGFMTNLSRPDIQFKGIWVNKKSVSLE